MFSLVCFEDDKLFVCNSKNISRNEHGITAKYKNRGSFTAKLLAEHDSKILLESIMANMIRNFPHIVFGRIDKNRDNYMNISSDFESTYEVSEDNVTRSSDSNYIPNSTYESIREENKNETVLDVQKANEDELYNYERVTETLLVPLSKTSKKYYCLYCKKAVTKLARHLENVHVEEKDVQKFHDLPKGSEERKKIIEILRKKGSFIYNTSKDVNDGDLIVSRRPNCARKGTHYKACPNCRGFFSKLTLRRHYVKCVVSPKRSRNVIVQSRIVEGLIHSKANNIMRNEIFPIMREDDVVRCVRNDELLILYGNKMTVKYKAKYHQKMIRARLRLLGRLLLELRSKTKNITNFASLLSPENYDNLIEAVNVLAELSSDGTKYLRPAVASTLGTLIKVVGKLYISECIKKKDDISRKYCSEFLDLLDEDYGITINKTVAESQSEIKRTKKIDLPIMTDIKLLKTFIEKNEMKSYSQLRKKFSFKKWKQLSSYVLINLLLFNRRRVGELERMLITDFENYQSMDQSENFDLYQNFTSQEKQRANEYVRVTIRGKLNRLVPVLIQKKELECLKLVIKFRLNAGVLEENKYVFGLPGINNYLKACDLLREYSKQCGAKYPERLRGTLLRKHIATRSAVLNFKEQEVSELANYLGHADKIHRDHYRIPLPARDITRMSKVLEQACGESTSFEDNPSDSKSDPSTSQLSSDESVLSETSEKPIRRLSWDYKERQAVKRLFSHSLLNGILPSLNKCADVIAKYKVLQSRTPQTLKAFINNEIKKNKRILEQQEEDKLRLLRKVKIRKSLENYKSQSF